VPAFSVVLSWTPGTRHKQIGPPFGGPFFVQCCSLTEPAQGLEQVRALEPARVQGLEQGLEQGPVRAPEPVLAPRASSRARVQALGPACWQPAAQRGPEHARHHFCQKHNTQQWPG
jgi:hypothetical protein